MNDVQGLTALGANMEHSLCMFVEGSKLKILEAEDLRKHIEAAGVDNTIMSTDLGQTGNIRPLEGFRRGISLCLDLGYSEADIRKMFSTNAAKLFGLEALVETDGGVSQSLIPSQGPRTGRRLFQHRRPTPSLRSGRGMSERRLG